MTNTPSSRPEQSERDLAEAAAHESELPQAAEECQDGDGQETLVWEGAEQLAALEASMAQADSTRMMVTDEAEELPPKPEQPPAPLTVDPRSWFLGRSFGGFRVVCELASGGMATVFLARKEGPSRVSKHAAIKVVHPHLVAERDFVHMFVDEARIAACLHHPNVCRVLDFGEAEGTYYMAMEYLLGETWSSVRLSLSLHSEGQTLLPAVAAHVLAQACEGLHAAHEAADDQGRLLHIVHRDVSPQNIFVAYDGTVRVLDFGVASAADRITSTREGILKGRLTYMSPEQMAGEQVGPRSDIWAMGVVLREALEGKRLFRRATDAETMLAVTSEPLPPWSVEPPARLAAIVERAMQRDPAARYASADEMGLALTRFAASQRGSVSASTLSTLMHDLFELQMEQKRALLQLPIPTPRPGSSPIAVSAWAASDTQETLSGEPRLEKETARPPARDRRRSLWPARLFKLPALLALGCLGAFTGIVLGGVLRRADSREMRVATLAQEPPPPATETLAAQHAPQAPEALDESDAPPDEPTPTATTPVEVAEERTLEARPQQDRAHAARAGARQQPRAAPPAVHAQRPGTLLISFERGWAEVYLGTKLLGTTPGPFELPAGRQTVIIKPFGDRTPFQRRVDMQPATVTKLFLGAPDE